MGDCKLRSAVEAALEHLESMGCDESTYDYLNDYFGREEGGDCAYVGLHKQLKDALQVEREATCEKSLQVGNNAKCREALLDLGRLIFDGEIQVASVTIQNALSAPPRNCDKFSKAEVLKLLDDRSFSKEDTIEWLYEAGGSHLL